MIADDILNLEKISYSRDIVVKVSKGKIAIVSDVRELPVSESQTLADILTEMNEKIAALEEKNVKFEDNIKLLLESINVLGGCTTSLSEQIEVLNAEVNN